MWDAHWTCCRQDWDSSGCKRIPHKGPYEEYYTKIKKEYQWPDSRAQIYFIKQISYLWRNKMIAQYDYDEETLLAKIEKKERDQRGRLSIRETESLCDYLHLNLLMDSDDMSYHFKFLEVVNKEAQPYFEDDNSNIDKEKFVKWWFMTTDELLHKNE
jgi:hypothetical protein